MVLTIDIFTMIVRKMGSEIVEYESIGTKLLKWIRQGNKFII